MLNNQTLTVDGRFAVARQASLNFETKLLGKGIMSKVSGGEGFVNIISGTGKSCSLQFLICIREF